METAVWTCTLEEVARLRWRTAYPWVVREWAGRTVLRLGMYAAIGAGLSVVVGAWTAIALAGALALVWTVITSAALRRDALRAWREWAEAHPAQCGPIRLEATDGALVLARPGCESRLRWGFVGLWPGPTGTDVTLSGLLLATAPSRAGLALREPRPDKPLDAPGRPFTAIDVRRPLLEHLWRRSRDFWVTPLRRVWPAVLLAILPIPFAARTGGSLVLATAPLAYFLFLAAWERAWPLVIPLAAALAPEGPGVAGDPGTFAWGADGLVVSGPAYVDRLSWTVVTDVEAGEACVFVEVDHAFVYVVPRNAFPDDDPRAFVDEARARISAAAA